MWIGTNSYTWKLVSEHRGGSLENDLPQMLDHIRASGLQGYEPIANSPEELDKIVALCDERGLSVRSIYVGGTFHEEEPANEALRRIKGIAEACAKHGITIAVCNPDPISWSNPEPKDDRQLRTEVDSFARVGAALREFGVRLAFHFHTPEFQEGARELHAVLALTDPQDVGLCLDTQWTHRGAGNSEIAIDTLVALYGDRIVSLHLRQSENGIWSGEFGDGDIDYDRIVPLIRAVAPDAPPVLEIAWEEGSPRDRDPVEIHREAAERVRRLWNASL